MIAPIKITFTVCYSIINETKWLRGAAGVICVSISLFSKDKPKIVCHCEERSDVTIPSGIASISTFAIIEAIPMWIVTHSSGMLTMTIPTGYWERVNTY